jgi:peptidoglycan/xylan/chitin deacetylase (PgdA/CDA1 family)
MPDKPFILLSFDVEEFDLPLEYGLSISPEEQMRIGKNGLDAIQPILTDSEITTTLFTTANFAIHHSNDIRSLAKKHEIGSHTFFHSNFQLDHLQLSKEKLEDISGTKVSGLRMPRMRKVPINEVKNAGYEYDSSVNPTYIPGRYNNLHLPRTMYEDEGVSIIPISVSPWVRFPLFWLSFKNLPYQLFKMLALQTLKKDGYLCIYFHPWEFTNIENFGIPGFTKKFNGKPLLDRLVRLLSDLKKEGSFITMNDFYNKKALGETKGFLNA